MNVNEIATTAEFDLPQWAAAEFLDTPYADGLLLRAVICRLGAGKWQWSIMSISPEGEGELITVGTEKTVERARQTAGSELDKCIRSPFA
jgi:hypothetical protein